MHQYHQNDNLSQSFASEIYWMQRKRGKMNLEEVRKVYDDWAPFYNPTHSWSLPKRRLARLMLNVHLGERVLDLACGTGANLPHLRELVGKDGQVVGVDLSPKMLNIARKMIEKHEWKNVLLYEADAANLPFSDGFFDKVICTYALNIIPNYVHSIEEIKRVLVPQGLFVSLEIQSGHSIPKWPAPICGIDLSHETLQAIKSVFTNVEINQYWQGMIFIVKVKK
jgi:ubiquinone/menaquinone biosynthesis C-methylase UbiE